MGTMPQTFSGNFLKTSENKIRRNPDEIFSMILESKNFDFKVMLSHGINLAKYMGQFFRCVH